MPMAAHPSLFIPTTSLYEYLLVPVYLYVLRQVRELCSSRDLEGVLDMPRRDGKRIRM
jgi:hypothetical protein